jgi:hypothetical protein
MFRAIWRELEKHAPFTSAGALSGVLLLLVFAGAPAWLSARLFWTLHPLHVLLSALTTTSMYILRGGTVGLKAVVIGYVGSIGIATLSDSLIPFAGEWMLDLPNRGVHVGFVEKWWLVNPLAFLGIGIAFLRPRTELPHAGHVLLSTWASLFHITLALGDALTAPMVAAVGVFLFLAVWIPCCASDIAFPLLFVRRP